MGERRGRKAGLGCEGEQEVLGAEVAVAKAARLLDRPCDGGARRIVEVFRPGQRRIDEAFVRGLLGDPERGADLRPRAAVGARGLDIAVEQLVAETAQLVRDCRCGPQAIEDARSLVGIDRRRELLECLARRDVVKVLLTLGVVKATLTRASRRLTSPPSRDGELGQPWDGCGTTGEPACRAR